MITLEQLCLTDTNDIRFVSDVCLQDDPACPLNALMTSPVVADPNDEDFTPKKKIS